MRARGTRGFTLIELLIVIVIIGILAAIAIPKFARTKERSYEATMKSDLRNLMTAQEMYFGDYQLYTTSLTDMHYAPSPGVTVTVSHATAGGWLAQAWHPATPTSCVVGIGSDSIGGVGDGVIWCK